MSRRISRREFNRLAAATGALALAPFGNATSQVRFASPPFQLGVASGDPSADGFVIWTRLAPEPFDTGYLGQTIFEVTWEVAEDPGFARIAKQGVAWARPHIAHAVHVVVDGLGSGHEYFYRFRIGRYESAAGRALTCPAPDAEATTLRFAFASCAHYEQGYFSAYRYMAEDRPDLILMLGDYIYEDAWGDRRVRLTASWISGSVRASRAAPHLLQCARNTGSRLKCGRGLSDFTLCSTLPPPLIAAATRWSWVK